MLLLVFFYMQLFSQQVPLTLGMNVQEQLNAIGFAGVHFLYDTVDANSDWDEVVDALLPIGKVVVITG